MSSSLPVACLCYLLMQQNVQTVLHRYSLKQVFLKISQCSQETHVLEPFFDKVFSTEGLQAILFKNRHQHSCFYVNIAKFLRMTFL